MITVVDVGLGNVASVVNMLARVGATSRLAASPDEAVGEGPIVLPGVGAFDTGVTRLETSGWFGVLKDLPTDYPVLGICLGMQLLGRGSEEGSKEGLSRVSARFKRFFGQELRVPHTGWNEIDLPSVDDPVFRRLPDHSRFYFTHSYYAVCDHSNDVVATTHYGDDVVAAYRSGGTYGVQFHPEKSHRFGMALMRSWLDSVC